MKRHFLWILPAVALLSPAFALAQEAPKATVADNLDVSVTTKKETEADGRKTTETNTGSFSVNDKETVTPDGKTTSDHGREVGFEHKTETEVSKGDHHEVKVSEQDSIRAKTDVSTDGDKGDTATVGIGYTKGYNADAETHAGADGKYAGGNAEADAHAHAGLDADATWTVGPDGIVGTADVRFGASAEAHAGADGRLGTEDYNVHVGADVKISAELAAEIKARVLAGTEGIGAEGEAKIGASVGAEGVIKGGVTIWGIPFDVTLAGGVKAGAEASARGGIIYDAETGMLTLEVGASAVAGVGAKGNVKVEIGVGELFGKVLDSFFGDDDEEVAKEDETKEENAPPTEDLSCPVPKEDASDLSGPTENDDDGPWAKADDETEPTEETVLVCEVLPLENTEDYVCPVSDAPNIPDTTEPDWREKHPIWAYIFENVLPDILRKIIDILIYHPDWTISDLLVFDENGNPIIHDGVPEFNPGIDIDGMCYPPEEPQEIDIPEAVTEDEKVYDAAKESNKNAEKAMRISSLCQCPESVAKRKELEQLIQQQKDAIEKFRQTHNAYEKSVDAISDRLGEVFIDIGGNAFGALMGPHIKKAFEAAATFIDLYCKEGLGFWEICWKVFEHFIDSLKDFFIWEPSGVVIIPEKMLKNIEKGFAEELGQRTLDVAAMFAKILVKLPLVMGDVLIDWWKARSANEEAKEKLIELTKRLDVEIAIFVANEGCYCTPGCQCPHCRKNGGNLGGGVICLPPEDDDPWTGGGGGGGEPPVDVVVVPGVDGPGGGDHDGLGELVSELGGLLDGIGDGSGLVDVTIPDFGLSGSDNPLVPDNIGDPDITFTASGLLNASFINADRGNQGSVVDGNNRGTQKKRKPGDIGGRGQKEVYSRP